MTSPRTARAWIKAAAARLALLGVTLGITVILLEVAFALALPQQLVQNRPEIWRPADTLGWEHRPQVSTTVNTGEKTVQMVTDQHGFRRDSIYVEDGGTPRILVLGDSFTAALQVEYEESLPGLMEASLRKDFPHVRVDNAGVDGWGPWQYYWRGRELLAKGGYDVTLALLFVGNDVVPNPRVPLEPLEITPTYPLRIPRNMSKAEWVEAIARPVNDWLESRSHLFIFVRKSIRGFLERMEIAPADFPVEFMVAEAGTPRWGITTGIISEIAALANASGSEFIVVLLPADYQMDQAAFDGVVRRLGGDPAQMDVDQPNRILADSLTGRGIEVVDLLPALRAHHTMGETLFGTVDRHFSPDGHRVSWETLAPQVQRTLHERQGITTNPGDSGDS